MRRSGSLPSARASIAAAVAVIGLVITAVSVPAAASAAPASCRAVPVDADAPLKADLAREEFGVDGSGVKVGIISNTFDLTGTDGSTANSTEAENIADGMLPGPGNPCGYEVAVHNLSDVYVGGPLDDEGRGMAQLVHGIAPAAEIYFASAGADADAMIGAVNLLAQNDVDIIVDDMSFLDEPMFQQSLLSQRMQQLRDEQGIVFLSAAGNETVFPTDVASGQTQDPVNGWRTSAYRPTTCDAAVVAYMTANLPSDTYDCMDFDASAADDAAARFTVNLDQMPDYTADPALVGYKSLPLVLQWGAPFGGATQQYLLGVEIDGSALLLPPAGFPTATDPVVAVDLPLDPAAAGAVIDLDVAIVRITTGATGTEPLVPVGFQFAENGPQYIESVEYPVSSGTDTVGRTVLGHNGDPAVISLAATQVGAGDRLDYYSSLGPVTYFVTPETTNGDGSLLPAPETTTNPDLLSVDGVRNTVLGEAVPGEPGVFVFDGTSAATPNAGAVVALGLQLNPDLDPETARRYLAETATPMGSPYPAVSAEDSVGAGLVNAQAFLQRVAADLPAPVPNQPGHMLASSGAGDMTMPVLGAALFLSAGLFLVRLRRRAVRD